MVKVKICCIQSVEEAELVIDAGADVVGLVGPMPSGPGPIPDARIGEIAASVSGRAVSSLLTCEQTVSGVMAHIERCKPSAVQLVDTVEAALVPALRHAYPELVIFQVVHVRGQSDVMAAVSVSQVVDFVLLDSGRPNANVPELGGTGRVHDWGLSREIVEAASCPVWLAGGLNPDNVADAVHQVRPYGVDVCSGLRPQGFLDADALRRFIERARGV